MASKLILDWSPEPDFSMVEGPLSQQREHACVPRNHLPQLIHPGPGVLKKELIQHLQVQTRPYTSLTAARSGLLTQAVPAEADRLMPSLLGKDLLEVEDRAIPGHWEERPA